MSLLVLKLFFELANEQWDESTKVRIFWEGWKKSEINLHKCFEVTKVF